jgi:Flp pilus assembly protein TadG
MIRRVGLLGTWVRRDDGSSLVEFALASMIFLALLIGAFQVSIGLYTYHYISDAAREGSRYAMVRGSTSCTNTPSLSNCNATADQIQTYVRGLGYPGISASKLKLTTTWFKPDSNLPPTWSSSAGSGCNAPGNMVMVVATYAYPLKVPFIPKSTFNLSSTSKMVISQ